jgi:ferredoxin
MDKLEIAQMVALNVGLDEETMCQMVTGHYCPGPQSPARRITGEVKNGGEGRWKLCRGVNNYVAIASTVLALDDQNKAPVLDPSSPNEQTPIEAAKSCPENTIFLEDDEGNQLYP